MALASAYKTIIHYARMTTRRQRSGGQVSGRIRPHFQRCAVRVTYTKNSASGQWRAHGRYVARESATHEGDPRAVGFNATEETIDIAARLEGWQKANDERLWKLIVSPEFGDRVDLKRLTRDLISQMEADLGTRLEWVAAAHFNTEHPHVHVALRGAGAEGRPLRLSRDFIREGTGHLTRRFPHREGHQEIPGHEGMGVRRV
jgi:type IV secretory pathway VirD2 relaxase